jgi:hypothetical protein
VEAGDDMDIWEIAAKYGPQIIPVLIAILVIVFTKQYVYRGMVPETMLSNQVDREKTLLKEQSDREKALFKEQSDREHKRILEQSARDKQVIEMAKDLEQHLEEIVFQLTSLTTKIS